MSNTNTILFRSQETRYIIYDRLQQIYIMCLSHHHHPSTSHCTHLRSWCKAKLALLKVREVGESSHATQPCIPEDPAEQLFRVYTAMEILKTCKNNLPSAAGNNNAINQIKR